MGNRRAKRVRASVIALGCVLVITLLSSCGSSSPAPSASPSPPDASVAPAWQSVAGLQAPLINLVVTNATGFDEAERKYLTRANIAWQVVQGAAADYVALGTADSGAEEGKALAKTVAYSTSMWLKMKTPSERFAPLHTRMQQFMAKLHAIARTAGEYERSGDADQRAVLANRIRTLSQPLAVIADRVVGQSEVMHDRFGRASTTALVTGPLSAAEQAQILAILQGSAWITGPLREASSMMSVPIPSWSDGDVVAFCLDMGFIQAECDNWINTPPAGPTIAAAYNEYVTGLRLLRTGASRLITAAGSRDIEAAREGAASLNEAAPYVSRAMNGFRALMPSAFSG